jgi:hypothetical protein
MSPLLRPVGTLIVLCTACGGSRAPALAAGAEAARAGAEARPAEEAPLAPEKPAPPALTGSEKSELAERCAPIEPDMYEAEKHALATLEIALGSAKAPDAEARAHAAGLEKLRAQPSLSAAELERCKKLFEKKLTRALFDFEPAEKTARETLDACVRRVGAAYGKKRMRFDEGERAAAELAASYGAFCPDDFPVPAKLADLPYKSKAEDWDTPAWRCLAFGLREEQLFQIEYRVAPDRKSFACIARFLPRQGGAAVELVRDGTVAESGELVLSQKSVKQRMK